MHTVTYHKYLRISFCILLAAFPLISHAEETQQLNDQVGQVKTLLTQIKKSLTSDSADSSYVYLGTDETNVQSFNNQLTQYQDQLNNFLATLNQHQSHHVSTLQWLAVQDAQIKNEKTFINAGDPNNSVYICRAPFIGLNPGNRAIYPGELIKTGCRISYAGYAFSVSKFDVLTGKNDGLQWIPISTVNEAIKKQTTVVGSNNAPLMPMPIFDFNININGAKPIAGGYQGGNPVLICRAKQNNAYVIGKVVLMNGGTGNICDIGVAAKEVSITHDFEVLFKK